MLGLFQIPKYFDYIVALIITIGLLLPMMSFKQNILEGSDIFSKFDLEEGDSRNITKFAFNIGLYACSCIVGSKFLVKIWIIFIFCFYGLLFIG
jgi:hypothetical protein